jgi:hypothetical protein
MISSAASTNGQPHERLIGEADAGRLQKTRAEVWEIITKHPSGI